ncbi:MAG: hypothetical protein ACM3OC_07990 [Deltaproteobacteria bacterium]
MGKSMTVLTLMLVLFAGCTTADTVKDEDVFGVPQVTEAKNDLSGMSDEAIARLAEIYIWDGKVFFYASPCTNAPIVDRGDITLAIQFKTGALQAGQREAVKFNDRMLEYIRKQLKFGRCPEHRRVQLLPLPIVYGPRISPKDGKRQKKGEIIFVNTRAPAAAPVKGFVCPVDHRVFVPYSLDRKARRSILDDPDAIAGGLIGAGQK